MRGRRLGWTEWSSHHHLGDALSTQGLAPDEVLALDAGQRVEDGCDQQHDGGRDQARSSEWDADKLDDAHDQVDASAHVVGRHAADKGIEFGRRRTDPEEEGDLDEDEDKGRGSDGRQRPENLPTRGGPRSHKQMMLKMMMMGKWRMLAMPRAKHRKMHSTPDLSRWKFPPPRRSVHVRTPEQWGNVPTIDRRCLRPTKVSIDHRTSK